MRRNLPLRRNLRLRRNLLLRRSLRLRRDWRLRRNLAVRRNLTVTQNLRVRENLRLRRNLRLTRRGQTTPQMFRQFLGISHYSALLKKYWLFLHQTWQMIRWPIANYIYVKNVSKCQSCDITVMTSCFLPLLKFLISICFTMCSKEHIKGSWNLKKFCPYHKNWMKYGIFKYEK